MTKTITKIGNSQGIIFDAALMDLARVKVGDQVKNRGDRDHRFTCVATHTASSTQIP